MQVFEWDELFIHPKAGLNQGQAAAVHLNHTSILHGKKGQAFQPGTFTINTGEGNRLIPCDVIRLLHKCSSYLKTVKLAMLFASM